MKKILLMAALLMFAIMSEASAQTRMTASADTNSNAVTTTHTFTAGGDIYNFDVLTVQVVGTKVSGTVAGTALIYGSIDGTNYVAISDDTLTLADQATNTKIWTLDKTRYKYYQVKVTTTGTQVSTWKAWIMGRRVPK